MYNGGSAATAAAPAAATDAAPDATIRGGVMRLSSRAAPGAGDATKVGVMRLMSPPVGLTVPAYEHTISQ